ncbi:MAG TPA: hypothetical protein VGV90_12170 [Solirubrobacteraceae bacterium]|nr:hypothetical protein [Solirubrobacteraceae bacterium]
MKAARSFAAVLATCAVFGAGCDDEPATTVMAESLEEAEVVQVIEEFNASLVRGDPGGCELLTTRARRIVLMSAREDLGQRDVESCTASLRAVGRLYRGTERLPIGDVVVRGERATAIDSSGEGARLIRRPDGRWLIDELL